ncbi:MAG: GntR family transcriptional regulator [Anaerolineales bacterium]
MIGSARTNSKTLTESAQQQIRQAILQGTFRPGSQLPGEMELGSILGVSRTVVREALRILEEDGLITRRHGVGTFVRKRPILNNLSFNFGTTEMIESAGMASGTRLLGLTHTTANDEVAEALALAVGEPVVMIERIRTADGKPVVYSVDYLPQTLVGKIDFQAELPALSESLYTLLQSHLGTFIEYGVARILPLAASEAISGKLGVAAGAILLYLVQTDYSPTDEPVLYSLEYHLPDAFDYMILRRGPLRLRGTPASPLPVQD